MFVDLFSLLTGLTQYSQSRVATQRILKFLDLEELAPYVDKTVPADGSTVIEMSHVSMSWVDAASVAEKQASDAVETAAKNAKMERQAHAQGYKTAAAQKAAADKKSSFSTAAAGPSSYAQVPTADGDVEAGKGEIELTAATTAVAEDTKNTPGAETSTLLPTSADATTASAGSEVDAKTSIKYDADLNRSVHTLVDMTFKIQKGELVAVVGTVGSGKSSFLNGLLGEMQLTQGSVRVHGRIAYCDQRPWILNDTVQGNVTFGLPYDEARFDAALYAANMEDDVIVLPGGINTQIGEYTVRTCRNSLLYCCMCAECFFFCILKPVCMC